MSIRITEFGSRLIFPTQKLEEVALLLSFFMKLGSIKTEVPPGTERQVGDSFFYVEATSENGSQVARIKELTGDGPRYKDLNPQSPQTVLSAPIDYVYDDVPGRGVSVQALVSMVNANT